MQFLIKRKKLIGDIIIALLLILIFQLNLLSYLEYKFQDMVYQKPTSTNPDIIVIGIDEKALTEIGRFQQWTRQTMADAINILNRDEENKPAVIALDIVYTGESDDREGDENLAKAAEAGGNVVVASLANIGEDLALNKIVKNHEIPYPSLKQHVTYGFANGTFNDGIVRYATLKASYEDDTIYSFPFEVFKKYTGQQSLDYVDNHTFTYITYYGLPGEYYGTEGLGLSFTDIFDEDFEPEYFADCIVFIGPFAASMQDSYYTSISPDVQMNGVEIHANIVQMMLENNFKVPIPDTFNLIIFLSMILFGMILAKFLDIRVLLVIFIVLIAGYMLAALLLYNHGYISMLLYPLLSLGVIYIYQLVYGYILETLEKQKVKNAFKKYVDPKLVDKLMETGEANSNEAGVNKDIAVLFVDIRGFTPMTEALKDQPGLIVNILNEYLELTSTSIFNNGGSVDKFIGDATMALFNGFVPLDDYVYKAVKAAWDIVQGATDVNLSIKEKYGVDVGFGVGVCCGDAIVGNLGPAFRKDYTAIGDVVNTAARLESNAKRSEILISESVYEIVKDRVEVESVGEIPLKGKSIKIEVFSVKNIIT